MTSRRVTLAPTGSRGTMSSTNNTGRELRGPDQKTVSMNFRRYSFFIHKTRSSSFGRQKNCFFCHTKLAGRVLAGARRRDPGGPRRRVAHFLLGLAGSAGAFSFDSFTGRTDFGGGRRSSIRRSAASSSAVIGKLSSIDGPSYVGAIARSFQKRMFLF